MKLRHIFLFLLAIVLGAGATILYLKLQEPERKNNQTQESSSSHLISQSSSSKPESSSSASSSSEPPQSFLNESIPEDASYKKTVLPAEMDGNELNKKINEFYQANYSEEEKAASQQALSQQELADLQNYLDQAGNVSGLETKVDQIAVKLGNQTSYVVRLVVPMTRQEANSRVKDSDIELMNQALSYVGNRLVLVAYYDQAKQAVVPVSLSNSSRPALFYYNVQP